MHTMESLAEYLATSEKESLAQLLAVLAVVSETMSGEHCSDTLDQLYGAALSAWSARDESEAEFLADFMARGLENPELKSLVKRKADDILTGKLFNKA